MRLIAIQNVCFWSWVGLLLGCAQETPKQLEGHWKLVSAERNGMLAESMTGLFYQFKGDSILTNFSLKGDTVRGTFSLEKEKLTQKTEIHVDYQIQLFKDSKDSMVLTTELQGYDFKLLLKKESAAGL